MTPKGRAEGQMRVMWVSVVEGCGVAVFTPDEFHDIMSD
jgi:hypothetical protein